MPAVVILLVMYGCIGLDSSSAQWPDHRGNLQRTAYVEQPLDVAQWEFAWALDYLTAPQPAWPSPARGSLWQELSNIEPRVNDDQADVPLIAMDGQGYSRVLIASSANDRLICVDPSSGQLQWEYVAEAPIRFAPTVRNGVAYFGADDGWVRAVSLSHGTLLWSTRIGPDLPWIVGNGRLISPHPIRTSVICEEGCVFSCAGLYPSQGVYAVSLDAGNGNLNWRRRLHRSPQGYLLLADDQRLIIPEGRAAPFVLSLSDGQKIGSLPSPGGSFCMLTSDAFFSGPGNAPRVESFPLDDNYRPRMKEKEPVMLPLEGRATAAGDGKIWVATGKHLVCYDSWRVLNQIADPILWQANCTMRQTLIVSGQKEQLQLFVAEGNLVHVYNATDGVLLHELSVPDSSQHLVYLAVSRGIQTQPEHTATLVATARSGAVFCWHGLGSDTSGRTSAQDASASQLSNQSVSGIALPGRIPVWDATDQSKHADRSSEAEHLLASLPVKTGAILVLGDSEGGLSAAIAQQSRFKVVNVLDQPEPCRVLQRLWQQDCIYGHKAIVRCVPTDQPIPFADDLFNAVVEVTSSGRDISELQRVLAPGSGRMFLHDQPMLTKPLSEKLGAWRHQYGNPANHSATQDELLGTATTFQLQWFGGVGPEPMPDRHLRGQAPLAAGASMILHGDGVLIGVDPANGFERWRLDLPAGSMRYVMPYDAAYSCLTLDGQTLYTNTSESLWEVDALTGAIRNRIPVRVVTKSQANDGLKGEARYRWGYLAEADGWLFATLMKSSAPRLSIEDRATARQRYSDQDYTSGRPLVCSRSLHSLTPAGHVRWTYQGGVIINGSISLQLAESRRSVNAPAQDTLDGETATGLDGGRIVFVEASNLESLNHDTDRIALSTLMQDASLICLDASSGRVLWREPIVWPGAANILYTQVSDDFISLVTSSSDEQADRASYAVRVHSLSDGRLIWEHGYPHSKKGLYHGEQVHHPVVLRQPNGRSLLVVEPFLYDLKTGIRHVPKGAAENWSLQRPGHSCGSLSGCGYSLFFRANNPTVLNLQMGDGGQFTALSPSRPGCWINMIPAAGRLLIPEASASCVCQYPIQTSMAFVPVNSGKGTQSQTFLQDLLPTH